MHDIHLIERSNLFTHITGSDNEWETGKWALTEAQAKSLIDGNVYLHDAQNAPCYLGGCVLSYTQHSSGRYILRFQLDPSLIGTKTTDCGKNWATEKLIKPRH